MRWVGTFVSALSSIETKPSGVRRALLVLIVLGLTPIVSFRPVSGQETPQTGQLIESVVVQCDLPRCQHRAEMARLESLVDISPGDPYDAGRLDAAVWFLEATQLFETVNVTEEADEAGGVAITFNTVGQRFIREVEIDTGLSLESDIEDSEIRQRIFMRPGQPFRYGDVERQRMAIEQLFERDGYFGTNVSIEPNDAEPFIIDLTIHVEVGGRYDIANIFFRGNTVFSYQQLRTMLLDEFGFFRTYTDAEFDDAQDAIIQEYREAGFIRARILLGEAIPGEDSSRMDLYVDLLSASNVVPRTPRSILLIVSTAKPVRSANFA